MSERVLVTGAGRGLGLEFVRQTLARGDQVFAGVRDPDQASELHALREEAGDRLELVPLDVSSPESIERAANDLKGRIDGLEWLINNAGINSRSAAIPDTQRNVDFGALEPEGILHMVRVNAVGPLLMMQSFIDLLAAGDEARVLNVSSWIGSIGTKSTGGNYGYATSKAALNMVGRLAAFDLAERGVTVLMFNPGWVRTEMGGAKARLSPEASVGGMLTAAAHARLEDAGKFLQWDGTEHPW